MTTLRVRPHFSLNQVALAITYLTTLSGLLVLSFDKILNDKWPDAGVSITGIVVVVALLVLGWDFLWLVVGGVWIYAGSMAIFRGVYNAEETGVGLICYGLAVGAMCAYIASRRQIL